MKSTGGKTVLVTGASSGIGAAIAANLARAGHTVFGTSRTSGASPTDNVEMIALDVRSDASVNECVKRVLSRAGHIDILVNNAGYLLAGAIEEATIEQAKEVFDTNVFGLVRMIKAVLPSMRERRSGLIVNVSSPAGIVPLPFWGYYNATKFAVEALSETLRFEVEPLGIRVAMVEPGAIKTPFYAQATTAALKAYSPWRERFFQTMKQFEEVAPGPEAVATVVARIVAKPRPRLRNGVTKEATIFPLLRWALPGRAFELALRRGFRLDQRSN